MQDSARNPRQNREITDNKPKRLTVKDRERIAKGMKRHARYISQDIRRMERIQADAEWLHHRDSNCGNAASLTDAILVLAKEAIAAHREELKECKAWASKRRIA